MKTKISFYQIFIFLIAFAILAYIFYDFVNRRKMWVKEGMLPNEPFYKEVSSEISSKEINSEELPSGISDLTKKSQTMELNQYIIKGSSNSAYSGKYISDEMVKYVLSRGCRFLDFEVYYLPISDDPPDTQTFAAYVGYSSDPSSVNSTTQNNYLFRKIFKASLANGFTRQSGEKYECPNPGDPLFIHIRIKTDDNRKKQLYDMIQSDIQSVYNNGYSDYFLMKTNNTTGEIESMLIVGNTLLNKLSKKVIIIFNYEPDEYIGTYHNMTSDSSQLMKYTYDELNTFKYTAIPPKRLDSMRTTADKFKMAMPDSNRSNQPNPSIYNIIKNYGIQITLMQYHVADLGLIRSETMFQQQGAGIMSMSSALNYIQTNDDEKGNVPQIFPQLFTR